MDYEMTENELVQAIGRIRTVAADDDDRSLVRGLLVLARLPGLDRYVARNITSAQAARLDWALER